MPYTHHKVGSKQCVYKKEDGTKVGCTSGAVDKYLGALHANANENENVNETENVQPGSLKNSIAQVVRVQAEIIDSGNNRLLPPWEVLSVLYGRDIESVKREYTNQMKDIQKQMAINKSDLQEISLKKILSTIIQQDGLSK